MKIYDECLLGAQRLIEQFPVKKLDIKTAGLWNDSGKNQMILQSDAAYELGKGTLAAVSSIALTDREDYVPDDEILLIGRDLPGISEDLPFARIALIRVNEAEMGSGDELYNTIRKIEFARYRLHPEGYMMRISAFTHREAVRVSRRALKNGLDFAKIGKMFIDKYKECPQVEAVRMIFVTDPGFPFDRLEAIMEKSEQITTALDHIIKNIKMDCETCSLKRVCDEVEALRNKENG